MNKFSINDFSEVEVENTTFIFGGANPNDCRAPNGGCTCETSGGELMDIGTYESDTQSYDKDGNVEATDYNNFKRN